MSTPRYLSPLIAILPGFITRDFWRKFFSLLLAVICCLLIHKQVHNDPSSQSTDTIDNVKLIVSLDDGLYIKDQNRNTVSVKIRKNYSQRKMLFTDNDFSFEFHLDSQNLVSNERQTIKPLGNDTYEITYNITPNDIRSKPADVTVTGIIPNTFTITCEKIIQKTVPVTIRTEGHLKEGFICTLDPPTLDATVRGPVGLLNEINVIYAQPIVLKDSSEGTQEVPIILRTISSKVTAEATKKHIRLTITDTKSTGKKRFDNIPLLVLNRQNSNLVLDSELPETVSAILAGLNTVLESLDNKQGEKFTMYIDLSSYYTPGLFHPPVKALNLPPGITKVEWVDPADLDIKLKYAPEADPLLMDPTPLMNKQ